MDIFSLIGRMREAGRTIAEDPIGQTRARHAAGHVDGLAQRVEHLEVRCRVLESLLAHALNLTPDKLSEAVEAEVMTLSRRKTVVELAKETLMCRSCQRPVHKDLKACQICGAGIQPA